MAWSGRFLPHTHEDQSSEFPEFPWKDGFGSMDLWSSLWKGRAQRTPGVHQPASPAESVSSEVKDTPVSKQKFFNFKSNRGSTQCQTPRNAVLGLSSSRAVPAWTWGIHIFTAFCLKCHSSLLCFLLKLNVSGHKVNSKFCLFLTEVYFARFLQIDLCSHCSLQP